MRGAIACPWLGQSNLPLPRASDLVWSRRHWQLLRSIIRVIFESCFHAIKNFTKFALRSDILVLGAGRAQTVEAMHNGLRPEVVTLKVSAGPEVDVQVRAVDVVGCFDVAHDASCRRSDRDTDSTREHKQEEVKLVDDLLQSRELSNGRSKEAVVRACACVALGFDLRRSRAGREKLIWKTKYKTAVRYTDV